MTGTDVLVAGAGIGGLVVAIGLRRVGVTVRVVEQRAEPGAIGAGIVLFPNALRALDALGVGDAVRSVAWRPRSGDAEGGLRLPSGRWVLRTRHWDDQHLLSFHRNELHGVLADLLPPGTVSAGTELVDARPDPGGVEIRLRGDGADETTRADVLVGADGVNSTVRSRIWPTPAGLRYAGYVAWRAVTGPGPWRIQGGETWGRGGRFGSVPLSDDRVYWYATANLREGSAAGQSPATWHSDVVARFGGWHAPIPELLAATRPEDVLRHDIRWIDPPLPTFVQGRAVLLGDAAHAMTPDLGQGACQAIEDAAVLTSVLAGGRARSPGEIDAALHEYDEARRPRTQRIARTAARLGRFAQAETRPAVAARTMMMRLVPPAVARSGSGWILSWPAPQIDA